MSPRRHRRAPEPPAIEAQRARSAIQGTEDGPDGRWHVRKLPGGASAKTYRCPGCDQEIQPGAPHVVAWPDDGSSDERRHWHTPCWQARHRRGPRNARRLRH